MTSPGEALASASCSWPEPVTSVVTADGQVTRSRGRRAASDASAVRSTPGLLRGLPSRSPVGPGAALSTGWSPPPVLSADGAGGRDRGGGTDTDVAGDGRAVR